MTSKKEHDLTIRVIPMSVGAEPDQKPAFQNMYEVIINDLVRIAFVPGLEWDQLEEPQQSAIQGVMQAYLYPLVVTSDNGIQSKGQDKTVMLTTENAEKITQELRELADYIPYVGPALQLNQLGSLAHNLSDLLEGQILPDQRLPEFFRKMLDS
jgi:hypothetical protein